MKFLVDNSTDAEEVVQCANCDQESNKKVNFSFLNSSRGFTAHFYFPITLEYYPSFWVSEALLCFAGSWIDVLLQHLQPTTVQLLQGADSQGQNVFPPRDRVHGQTYQSQTQEVL